MSTSETTTPTEIYTGRVKWFNNKSGYGFATIVDGSKSGTDVFVHHTSLYVGEEQYRYLVQGEYVQFYLAEMGEGPHKYQTKEVCGINGGPLMCETLLETGKQIRSKQRHYETREAEVEPRPDTRRESRPDTRRETRPDTRRETRPDTRRETRTDTRRPARAPRTEAPKR